MTLRSAARSRERTPWSVARSWPAKTADYSENLLPQLAWVVCCVCQSQRERSMEALRRKINRMVVAVAVVLALPAAGVILWREGAGPIASALLALPVVAFFAIVF